jgi:MFS family permease
LLPLGLFREAPFVAGSAASFFAGAAMFGALVHVPLLVQWGQGTDATTAGLSLMTMSTGWSIGGLVAGQLLNLVGFGALAAGGMALMTTGYVALALQAQASWPLLLGVGGAIGLGMGLVSITLIVATQTLIRREQRGVATSGVLFFRNIGATLGVAAMGAVLTARLGPAAGGLSAGTRVLPPALATALVAGIGAAFWLGVGAAVLGLAATCFLPRTSPASADADEGTMDIAEEMAKDIAKEAG